MKIIFAGDSDIARWPKELYPSLEFGAARDSLIRSNDQPSPSTIPHIFCCARDGATIADTLDQISELTNERPGIEEFSIFVVCAGENDLSIHSIEEIESNFKSLLSVLFKGKTKDRWLILLGPKLEPWIEDDFKSRKNYIRLSNLFERSIQNSAYSQYIYYINCLMMFCGKSAHQPGALWQKALPEPRFFDSDLLHLSTDGYTLWKEKTQATIQDILALVTDTS